MFLPQLQQKNAGDLHFVPGAGTVEDSKPKVLERVLSNTSLVVGKAEDEGLIKWNGFGWWHLECAGSILSVNGRGPAHLECRICGTEFKKQAMLSH